MSEETVQEQFIKQLYDLPENQEVYIQIQEAAESFRSWIMSAAELRQLMLKGENYDTAVGTLHMWQEKHQALEGSLRALEQLRHAEARTAQAKIGNLETTVKTLAAMVVEKQP